MSEQKVHRSANCWCGHGGSSHFGAGHRISCGEGDRPMVDIIEKQIMLERRRYDRVPLPHPVRTTVGTSPAYVVDASITGLGLVQQSAPDIGASCRLMFHSDFGSITLQCEIVRANSVTESTYQTGLRIVAADDE